MKIISRAEAKASGATRYFTGKPCKHGHVVYRNTSDGGCVECTSIKKRRYREIAAKNRELSDQEKVSKLRSDALATGSGTYLGRPCKNGHSGVRNVISRDCIECSVDRRSKNSIKKKEYDREYHARNRVRRLAEFGVYRSENKDKIYNLDKSYRLKNKKRIYARQKIWVSANRRRVLDHKYKYSSKKRRINVRPSWYGEFDEFVISEARALMRIRTAMTGIDWHVDHMIPILSKDACGFHCGLNVQVIPGSMNMSKRNKLILTDVGEWISHL
jgi:hypothetical protein